MAVVINLFGGPGSGKSTTMARLFSDLKQMGYNCEMVTEFAKDLVYENRMDTMKDELYIFAKQNHRLFRVKDKVDIIITDRPLLLTCIYDGLYGFNDKDLHQLVRSTFNRYNNVNILLKPVDVDYKTEGRLQDKEESDEISELIYIELVSNCIKTGTEYQIINTKDYESILSYVVSKLNDGGSNI